MKAQCIRRPELAEFLQGKVADNRAEQIATHVDACNACQDTVVALSGMDDTFVDALQHAKEPDAAENNPAFRHGLQRLLAGINKSTSYNDSETSTNTPTQIGPYIIQQKLGSGGMGTVFLAEHSKLKRTVALKVLSSHRWANTTAIARFEREMEAIGQLDHPYIVRASDAGEDQGMHYLVMEFVDGLDLDRLTKRMGNLPVADACELARQAAIGLQHAHDNGLVHRDIKPSNLMLAWERSAGLTSDTTPTVKILDMGLALLGDEHLREGHEVTTVGTLMGTLDYMSPEQGIDSHSVDHRADIYGLGATLFKLLSGQAPYADPKFSTLMKKMTALATKAAPSLRVVRDDLPQQVVEIVDRMLARDPDERYQSAREVAEALADTTSDANLGDLLRTGLATEELEQAAVTTPLVRLNSAVANPSQTNPAQPHVETSPKQSGNGGSLRRWLLTAAAGFILLAAGFAYRISTDFGDIVFHTDEPNVKVEIKRAGESVRSLNLEQGDQNFRIRSGEYVVEIVGNTSGLTIEPKSKIEVRRDGPVELSITRNAERLNENVVGKRIDLNSAPDAPLYDGRTMEQWIAEVQFERKPEKLGEALQALRHTIGHKANATNRTTAANVIFDVMRQYGNTGDKFHDAVENDLNRYASEALFELAPDNLADRIILEIRDGNNRSRDFLFHFLESAEIAKLCLARDLGSAVVATARNEHEEWGVKFLFMLATHHEADLQNVDGLVSLLQGSLKAKSDEQAAMTAWLMSKIAPHSSDPVDRINAILAKPIDDDHPARLPSAKAICIGAVFNLGPKAAPTVRNVAKILFTDWVINQPDNPLYQNLADGNGATDNLRDLIIHALARIGKAAKPAIPYLVDVYVTTDGRELAERAILKIDPALAEPIALIKSKNGTTPVDIFGRQRRPPLLDLDSTSPNATPNSFMPVIIDISNVPTQSRRGGGGGSGGLDKYKYIHLAAYLSDTQRTIGKQLVIRVSQATNDRYPSDGGGMRNPSSIVPGFVPIETKDGNFRILWPSDHDRALIVVRCLSEVQRSINENRDRIQANEPVSIDLTRVTKDALKEERGSPAMGLGGGMF